MSIYLPDGCTQAMCDAAIQDDEPTMAERCAEWRDRLAIALIRDLEKQIADRDREIAELRDKYEPGWRECPW